MSAPKIIYLNLDETVKLTYVVIVAHYRNQWLFVRHRERSTWETPAGHIERGENPESAARRELFEETGAIEYELVPVCKYSVDDGQRKRHGQLFYARINKLGSLPESEIDDIKLYNDMPKRLTYPNVQPHLIRKVWHDRPNLD